VDNPSVFVDIQDMDIVEIDIAQILASVIVSSEDDDGCSSKCSAVPPSRAGWVSFDEWECPEPFAIGC